MGWLVLGLRPAGARRAEWLKRGVGTRPKVGMSFARTNGREARPKRRYALMKVLIGVDPHKASVAVAVLDEDLGELLERATFPQDRAGLRSLERSGRSGFPSVVGQWRTPVVSAGI